MDYSYRTNGVCSVQINFKLEGDVARTGIKLVWSDPQGRLVDGAEDYAAGRAARAACTGGEACQHMGAGRRAHAAFRGRREQIQAGPPSPGAPGLGDKATLLDLARVPGLEERRRGLQGAGLRGQTGEQITGLACLACLACSAVFLPFAAPP